MKFLRLCLVLMMFIVPLVSADGPNTGTSAVSVDDGSAATPAWADPGNALTSNDVRAIVTLDKDVTSETLSLTGYGFTIPAEAIIDGILVYLDRQRQSISGGGIITDGSVKLMKAGVVVGGDRATATSWTSSDVSEGHGGTSDLWDTTWTPAEINAADFGVALTVARTGGTLGVLPEARIDSVTVVITYHIPDTTPPIVTVPDDMTVEATELGGAVVVFDVTAEDEIDPSPSVECAPASGSTFTIADSPTLVTCTATDESGNAAEASFSVTVTPGALDELRISPDGAEITAGSAQAFMAESYDSFGNLIEDVTEVTEFGIDDGSCTGADCTSTVAGTRTVTGTYEDVEDAVELSVVPGPSASIRVEPDDAEIGAGDSQAFIIYETDEYGNTISDVTDEALITIDDGSCESAECTTTLAGTRIVTAAYGEYVDDAELTVVAAALARFVVSPDGSSVTTGTTQEFTAEGFDVYDNSRGDMTADVVFSITEGAGGGFAGNVYSADVLGTWTVTGTFGELSEEVSVTVTAVPAASAGGGGGGGSRRNNNPVIPTVTTVPPVFLNTVSGINEEEPETSVEVIEVNLEGPKNASGLSAITGAATIETGNGGSLAWLWVLLGLIVLGILGHWGWKKWN